MRLYKRVLKQPPNPQNRLIWDDKLRYAYFSMWWRWHPKNSIEIPHKMVEKSTSNQAIEFDVSKTSLTSLRFAAEHFPSEVRRLLPSQAARWGEWLIFSHPFGGAGFRNHPHDLNHAPPWMVDDIHESWWENMSYWMVGMVDYDILWISMNHDDSWRYHHWR